MGARPDLWYRAARAGDTQVWETPDGFRWAARSRVPAGPSGHTLGLRDLTGEVLCNGRFLRTSST